MGCREVGSTNPILSQTEALSYVGDAICCSDGSSVIAVKVCCRLGFEAEIFNVTIILRRNSSLSRGSFHCQPTPGRQQH